MIRKIIPMLALAALVLGGCQMGSGSTGASVSHNSERIAYLEQRLADEAEQRRALQDTRQGAPTLRQTPTHHAPALQPAPQRIVAAFAGVGFTRQTGKENCEKASAHLPLSVAGSIKTPSHLAALVEQSLSLDSSGNEQISGTNMSPNMYLASINAAKVRVEGVGALPVYLRSLKQVRLPDGRKYRMSRVLYRLGADCLEHFSIDIKKGYARSAHPNEDGWIDPNDSTIVLAADCTNSPLDVEVVDQSSTSSVSPTRQVQSNDDDYCLWARVRGDERGALYLRLGSLQGEMLDEWSGSSLRWSSGPKSGWYTKVCLTEGVLQLAEQRGEDLFLCNKWASVRFRRDRDFALFRSQPDFPKEDAATLGTGY